MKNVLRFPRLSLLPLAAALLGASGCASKPVLDNPDRPALQALVAEVDQARLMGLVADLVTAHEGDTKVDCSYFPGLPLLCQLSNQSAGALVQSRFEALGLATRRHEIEGPRFPTSNIVAELPGVSRPEEIILVGAHYDSFYSGADDNSSGVAAMLELARVLSAHRFDRTVRFVAFDLEELGLIGSTRYVDTVVKNERLMGTVIFDCLAYYSTQPGSQGSLPGLPTPATGDFLAVIANDLSSQRASELHALNELLGIMKVTSVISPGEGTYPMGANLLRSDHAPFWLTGQDAIFLSDTANFRNPNYHRASDTLDTLDPVSFRKAVQVSAAGLAYWAGGPR